MRGWRWSRECGVGDKEVTKKKERLPQGEGYLRHHIFFFFGFQPPSRNPIQTDLGVFLSLVSPTPSMYNVQDWYYFSHNRIQFCDWDPACPKNSSSMETLEWSQVWTGRVPEGRSIMGV